MRHAYNLVIMFEEIPYDRNAVFEYAKKWALGRNPAYDSFDGMGGDCTNFASQCIFSGCNVMNYTPMYGWFYVNLNRRTPSWTGVQYLYNFLMGNSGQGPYGKLIDKNDLLPGDLVQLGNGEGVYYHSPVVVANHGGLIMVAAHTYDVFYYPLSLYNYAELRCIRIAARKWVE